ncbi:hypothetical protein ACP6PL_15225 [Dapis sp. BLCC M126]|uniref:hypothetical protein n=1 Tax=Dapis sp. BLCC M126 TaxID=3400189 RepID=UPI003CF7DC0C
MDFSQYHFSLIRDCDSDSCNPANQYLTVVIGGDRSRYKDLWDYWDDGNIQIFRQEVNRRFPELYREINYMAFRDEDMDAIGPKVPLTLMRNQKILDKLEQHPRRQVKSGWFKKFCRWCQIKPQIKT